MSAPGPISSAGPPPQTGLRAALGALALILGVLSVWLSTAELIRPRLAVVPNNAQAAELASAERARAATAARIGLVRGDLWADDVLTYANLYWSDVLVGGRSEVSAIIEQARIVAERAVIYAPHDARAWLVLASLASRFDWLDRKAAAALRMSYYTGSGEFELVPLRLGVALRSNAIFESELQQLVQREMRAIVAKRPDLKPSIRQAYDDALPEGRVFIEQALSNLDPALLATFKSNSQRR
jgi:hypothetical protein